ncbi:MAG: T9SS type A sorting domain-containing protein [Bacteroidota bacterium]
MKIPVTFILVLVAGTLTAQTFKAVNDTVDLVPGVPVTICLLANDTIPAGDSVTISGGVNFTRSLVTSTWKSRGWFTYVANHWGYQGMATSLYTVTDVITQKTSTAKVVCRIRDNSYDSLIVNNVDAWFSATGLNFLLCYADPSGAKGFIVRKGGGLKTIFSNSVWLGAKDSDSNIYFAGERYRQGGVNSPGSCPDYYAGPVMDSANYSVCQDTLWNYIWNLKKAEIDYHKQHWQDPGYQPVHDISTWPGNGSVNYGQAARLAPFFDRNHDGIYNPMDGDYPLIRGDQSLYFIFNENRGPHLESACPRSLKAEFHVMAYGWDMPGDSAFKNTVFMNYRIFNRSQRSYYSAYVGTFSDIDIGFIGDDYIGSDVSRSSYYGYNGVAIDGAGQPYGFGAHPPAQAVTILAGPAMAPLATDRPRVDGSGHPLCNESINGVGFGDGIAGNERPGLSNFIQTKISYNSGMPFMNDPVNYRSYYNYLRSRWMDSTEMIYGGLGHAGFGGYGPACRLQYPGQSDTLDWGAGCQAPYGQQNWTELTAGAKPDDIKGVGSVGPFTFRPGEMKELDLAFIYARDYSSPDTLASVTKLMQMIDVVRNAFATNRLPDGQSFTKVEERMTVPALSFSVYPNPAFSRAHVVFNPPLEEPVTVRLFDDQGRLAISRLANIGATETILGLAGLAEGLYLVVVQSPGRMITRKLSVVK